MFEPQKKQQSFLLFISPGRRPEKLILFFIYMNNLPGERLMKNSYPL